MDLRCPHCGEPVTAGMKVCPRCEADLHEVSTPKTIQELQQYCLLKNIPAEQMRFFIGEDYQEPKAFGIYQADDGRYVVYKNKADGTRAIRYEGYDEAYAVTEILQKMQSEVDLRYEKKQHSRSPAPDRSGSPRRSRTAKRHSPYRRAVTGCLITVLITAVILSVIGFALMAITREPDTGYYYYDDDYYYYLDDDWYRYEDDDWVPADADEGLRDDYDDYYVGYGPEEDVGVDSFYSTPYFQDYSERQSYDDYDDDDDWNWDDDDDWGWDDDDDDWDWDDWDTDDTDWDSDW